MVTQKDVAKTSYSSSVDRVSTKEQEGMCHISTTIVYVLLYSRDQTLRLLLILCVYLRRRRPLIKSSVWFSLQLPIAGTGNRSCMLNVLEAARSTTLRVDSV